MIDNSTERTRAFRKRKKLKEAGYKPVTLWVLDETAKLLRWGIRDKIAILKPRKEVVDNANEIINQLKEGK